MGSPEYTYRRARYAHPRRLQMLQAHFNSIVAIERHEIGQDPFGQETIEYIPDLQLSTINGYKEPQTAGTGEQRDPEQTIVINRWLVYLQGYYPTIRVEDRAIIDGVPHNIINVAHDDSKTLTTLATEIIDPSSNASIPN